MKRNHREISVLNEAEDNLTLRYYTVTNGQIIFSTTDEEEDVYEDEEGEDYEVEMNYYDVLEPIDVGEFLFLEDDLWKAFRKDKDLFKGKGLAEYLRDDYPEVKYIYLHSVKPESDNYRDVANINTTFEVGLDMDKATHTMEEIDKFLKEELLGQCGDGWGEGFEQFSFAQGSYDDHNFGDYYFSAWTKKSECVVSEESMKEAKKHTLTESLGDDRTMVYVDTYKKYAEGKSGGAWLYPSDYDSYEDFVDACHELHKDEEDPEFMYPDSSLPDGLYKEYSFTENDYDWCVAYDEMNSDEKDAFIAFSKLRSPDDEAYDVDAFHEQYICNECYTDSALGEYIIFNMPPEEYENASDFMQSHFDYESYGRDLRLEGSVTLYDGYAFWG